MTDRKVIALDPSVRKIDAGGVAETQQAGPTITQDAIARIFAEQYADCLRYCHSTGAWFEFNEAYWHRDETDRAFEFVRTIAREISEGSGAKELKGFRTTAFASGVERFARSDRAFAVTAEHWDRDPYLLGTPGGTVNLRTGELCAASPADGITKTTAVAPAEQADCPIWERFIRETTGEDHDLARFLQQWFGYCLTGDIRQHALVFGYGPGGNGKSVLLNTISGIMGAYAITTPAETFATSITDRHPTELARLRGARLVAASETEHGRAWAESRIKQLTGGDKISARFMRQDLFEFMPQFKLMIVGNHQPQLQHVDDALRRRFNIVPFLHRPDVPDLHLEEALRKEWPGILRWTIRGCLDWQDHGLIRPQKIIEATEDYFADQDLLGQWLAACCDLQPGNDRYRESSSALYGSWTAFAKAAGQKPESEKAFVGNLKRRRFVSIRTTRFRGFKGIALKTSSNDA